MRGNFLNMHKTSNTNPIRVAPPDLSYTFLDASKPGFAEYFPFFICCCFWHLVSVSLDVFETDATLNETQAI